MPKIFIVEDDIVFLKVIEKFLTNKGYSVKTCLNFFDGMKQVEHEDFDLALLDYRLPNGNGIEILNKIRKTKPHVPAIIMTSLNEVRLAVKAVKAGAFEYITKPINHEELMLLIHEAIYSTKDSLVSDTTSIPISSMPLDFVKPESETSKKLLRHIEMVSPTNMTVLLTGESGTGKEYVARLIHASSNRSKNPFVALDCGMLTAELGGSELFGHIKGAFTGAIENKVGAIQRAHKGTLFLDEIGNLNYEVQIKLLRFLQEKTFAPIGSEKSYDVDIRVILATNENLMEAIIRGDFRSDLFHRINEFPIHAPSLRNRIEDFDVFVKHFLNIANIELNKNIQSIDIVALNALKSYHWPGNLRELKNTIKRAVLLCNTGELNTEHFPYDLIHGLYDNPEDFDNLKDLYHNQEKQLILKALKDNNYNKSKTAEALKIDRKTLYNKLERLKIKL
jgi:two-component system, NtrC family, response regulator HydG